MPAEKNTGLKWEKHTMEDGVSWYRSIVPEIPNSPIQAGSTAVLTSEGNKLFKNARVWLKMLVYKKSVDSNEKKPHVRKYLGGEGNGTVYSLGKSRIAIKEAGQQQSIHFAIERMDILHTVISKGQKRGLVPKWIGLPKHYGYLIPPIDSTDKRQYMIMEQIDGGVTVEDVLSHRGSTLRNQTNESFSDEEVQEIREQWELLKPELETAIQGANQRQSLDQQRTPKQLLPDLHEGNVLIERLPRKIDGQNFKLWVIDQ